jgi:hypothetical protein
MNHIVDKNGDSIFFGDDFVIRERKSESMKELILYAAGKSFVLSRKSLSYNFSSSLPGQVLADFSEDK